MKTILDIIRSTQVTDFLNYRDYLLHLYTQRKDQESAYSYQQFSQDLDLGKTNLSWLYITGRRNLSDSTKLKVIKALGLKGKHRRYFELLVDYNKVRAAAKREELFRKLMALKNELVESDAARQNLEYFSEWYHPVIRELVATADFQPDVSWIVKKLQNRIMPKDVKKSLQLLCDLRLIRFDEQQGTYVQEGPSIFPNREVGVMAAARYHQKMIDIAREAVTKVPEKNREMHALTLGMSSDGFQKLQEKILEWCQQAMDIEESEDVIRDVYQLNVQFFPFTKGSRK